MKTTRLIGGIEMTELAMWSAFFEIARTRAAIRPWWRRLAVQAIVRLLEKA